MNPRHFGTKPEMSAGQLQVMGSIPLTFSIVLQSIFYLNKTFFSPQLDHGILKEF